MTGRRALLAALAAWPLAALAEAPSRALRPVARPVPEPPPRLDDILAGADLSGRLGFVVIEAATGRVIEARDQDMPMPPASTLKAITALYALDRLRADHRFVTRLLATGPVVGGMIQGDLILAGGGDPVLTTDDLARLALALPQAGIRGVTGRFRVWAGALPAIPLIDPGQLPQHAYNPAIGGLNLNFNRVHFSWEPAGGGDWRVQMDARTDRHVPVVGMARMSVVPRDLPVYTYEDGGTRDLWTVAASALGTEAGARWLPVRKPAIYAAEVFRLLAEAQGVTLPEAEPASAPDGTEVARHDSAPLTDLLRDMLEFSTNLTAEVLGLSASGAGSLAGSARAMAEWAAAQGIRGDFVDHSGLGDASAISPVEMGNALARAWGGALPGLLKSIPLLDPDGEPLARPPGSVVAKTGTLNFVTTLAGYLQPAQGGPDMAFAIFAHDPQARARALAAGDEIPDGARAWNRRARALQQALLQRWATGV
jgi:D-alanyl-D-alanine carboxypeptidase/D-alanyl-D-alanine-endopeptidase (penicillin-binding protein 4)